MSNAQIDFYCAPDLETFSQTVAELRIETAVLQEAATAVQGEEVAYVLCGKPPNFTVMFAAPIDQRLSGDDLQMLAQGIVDYYYSEIAKARGDRA